MSNRFLVSGAAALAAVLGATAAAAEVPASGYVSLRGARHKIKISGASDTITAYGVDGAVVVRPAGRYNIQLNGAYDEWDTADPALGLSDSDVFAGDAHLFWGRENVYTVGGFVSIFEYDAFDLANETVYGGGVEFDVYRPASTASMQAGLFLDEEDSEIYAVSGQVRFYPTPVFSLEGSAAFGNVDAENDLADRSAYGVGAEAEFQFEDTPFSVFTGARYSKTDDYDLEETSLMIGARWNFGTGDLIARDRTGASMRGSQAIVDLLAR